MDRVVSMRRAGSPNPSSLTSSSLDDESEANVNVPRKKRFISTNGSSKDAYQTQWSPMVPQASSHNRDSDESDSDIDTGAGNIDSTAVATSDCDYQCTESYMAPSVSDIVPGESDEPLLVLLSKLFDIVPGESDEPLVVLLSKLFDIVSGESDEPLIVLLSKLFDIVSGESDEPLIVLLSKLFDIVSGESDEPLVVLLSKLFDIVSGESDEPLIVLLNHLKDVKAAFCRRQNLFDSITSCRRLISRQLLAGLHLSEHRFQILEQCCNLWNSVATSSGKRLR
uniref:Fanconi anemia group D2 protein n=1 Tax=Macrostomum lignano TaxID=282301 RepID=A0A1I8IUK2_9PLAT